VTVREGKGERKIYRTVGYGSSFGGNPLRQHIGIGGATRVERLEIEWPTSGTRQVFTEVPADRTFQVREGRDVLVGVVSPTSH
jgi:hypothetical protein